VPQLVSSYPQLGDRRLAGPGDVRHDDAMELHQLAIDHLVPTSEANRIGLGPYELAQFASPGGSGDRSGGGMPCGPPKTPSRRGRVRRRGMRPPTNTGSLRQLCSGLSGGEWWPVTSPRPTPSCAVRPKATYTPQEAPRAQKALVREGEAPRGRPAARRLGLCPDPARRSAPVGCRAPESGEGTRLGPPTPSDPARGIRGSRDATQQTLVKSAHCPSCADLTSLS